MTADKRLTETRAIHVASGTTFHGYEIHIGRTSGPDRNRPFASVDGRNEGAVSADGRITGSYLHGMFRDDAFRAAWLASLGAASSQLGYDAMVEATLDQLADHMEAHLNVAGLLALAT